VDESEKLRDGGCLCGGVRYRVTGKLRDVWACHCSQCRRTSGNFVTATNCKTNQLEMLSDKTLAWFRSSPQAERGFCKRCGGNLFWREVGGATISIMAGTLDAPTGLRLGKYIFVGDKSDYYDLHDDIEKHATWPGAKN
jgi:hypothetical protein